MNIVAYLRIESLASSEHNPFSQEDKTQFMGDNAARMIEQEWNKYGPVVKVDVVAKCDSHSQAFTDMLAALEQLMGCPYGIDYASVPQAVIESAPPYQVVGSMSVALTRYMQARAAIAAARKEMGG